MIVTRGIAQGISRLQQSTFPGSSLSHATWTEIEGNPALLEGASTIVNLAGATLNQRWSSQGKRRIMQSRLESTHAVARAVLRMSRKPDVIVQGSAVGIYGASLADTYDESSVTPVPPSDFLAEVTTAWEAAADQGFAGNRLIKLRTGVVLGNDGGAYPLMRLPYLLGTGGNIGNGQQWIPWIHIRDVVRLIDYCTAHPEISGPVNAVSPQPVTNREFGRTVCRVHRRPFWLPLPAPVLRTVLGERSMLLLDGQQVVPKAVLEAGFDFAFPELESAVADLKTYSQNGPEA